MFEIFKMLKPTAGSSEIASAIEKMKVALADAEHELEDLLAERGAVLLEGDDGAMRAHEDKTSAKRLEVERAQVALAEMGKRHDAALSREAAKEHAQRLAADRAALESGLADIGKYNELGAAAAECLARIDSSTAQIQEGNRLRNEARTARGDDYVSVPTPEEFATANGPGQGKLRRDLCHHVVLPIAGDSCNHHWPLQALERQHLGFGRPRALPPAKAS
jgi:hypothetical protein